MYSLRQTSRRNRIIAAVCLVVVIALAIALPLTLTGVSRHISCGRDINALTLQRNHTDQQQLSAPLASDFRVTVDTTGILDNCGWISFSGWPQDGSLTAGADPKTTVGHQLQYGTDTQRLLDNFAVSVVKSATEYKLTVKHTSDVSGIGSFQSRLQIKLFLPPAALSGGKVTVDIATTSLDIQQDSPSLQDLSFVSGALLMSTTSGNVKDLNGVPACQSVEFSTKSGNFRALQPLVASDHITFATTSGNVDCKGVVDASSVSFKTDSGDLTASALSVGNQLALSSTSGDLQVDSLAVKDSAGGDKANVQVQTTSGDVALHGVKVSNKQKLDFQVTSTSGKIDAAVVDPVPSFSFDLSGESGDLKTNTARAVQYSQQSERHINGKYNSGQGATDDRSFKLGDESGNINFAF
ncbi:hypothetical protein RI367_001058 [Sorochytrium milnesiophthora]